MTLSDDGVIFSSYQMTTALEPTTQKERNKNMKHFTNCKTAEDLKQEYKKKVRELHPDCNPGKDTTAEFQQMQEEYTKAWELLKNKHMNAEGEAYEKETTEKPEEFMDILEKLIHLQGIQIELCGSWLWISGNTIAHKDIIKGLGFKWSKNKSAWYYHRDSYRKRSKNSMSMDEIRSLYGSAKFDTEEQQKITA